MTLGADFQPILDAARVGSDWAWDAIYADLAPSVLGYLRARGAPDPEDLLGEVFLRVVKDVDGFSGEEHGFRAWILTIARHRLVDARRSASRRVTDPVGGARELDRPAGDVEAEAMAGLATHGALRMFARLTPEQQDVLLLRLLGDLTVEEVARIINKSPGAVKALQRRGLATVRRELSNEGVTL